MPSTTEIRDLEFALQSQLRGIGPRAAIVNGQGRVIVSSSIRQVTGSLVREPDVPTVWPAGQRGESHAAGYRLLRCADLPIALLTRHSGP